MPRGWFLLIPFAVLLAVPELFYLGLTFSPFVPALCFALSAHLLIRMSNQPSSRKIWQRFLNLLSVISFGLSVSFQAIVIIYGAVILVDLWSNKQVEKDPKKRLSFGVLWGAAALGSSLLMIVASGNSVLNLGSQLQAALYLYPPSLQFILDGKSQEFVSTTFFSVLTPAFILFSFLGFGNMVRTGNPLLWIVLAGFFGLLPWFISGALVTSLALTLPVLLLCFVHGFILSWNYFSNTPYLLVYPFFVILLLAGPWFVKFRVASSVPAVTQSIYGHGSVLLGSEWKNTVTGLASDRSKSIDTAISMGIPLVITSWTPDFYLADLYALGYTTDDPANRTSTTGNFTEHRFSKPEARSVSLYFNKALENAYSELMPKLKPLLLDANQVVLVGNTEILRELNDASADNLTSISRSSAIFDFPRITYQPQPITGQLTNPGIGWQHDPQATIPDPLPETVSYITRSQITWKILNPSEGVYDWSPLDEQLSLAAAHGNQISFRVSTMGKFADGGERVPDWVLEKGAVILESGEPDYSNCTYQQEWGTFVNALQNRYDGNPLIAFLDIAGYGEFNEWSWGDQTEWDDMWDEDYAAGHASRASLVTLDGQARRRLADIFIGGSFNNHSCRDLNQNVVSANYSYPGFQKTQLVMPYAGIRQSLQYVFSIRTDVGFRYDCLGRESNAFLEEIDQLWRRAPIVFELCTPDQVDFGIAKETLAVSHGSLVHNNDTDHNAQEIQQLVENIGYRYSLSRADLIYFGIFNDNSILLSMIWQNIGSAPNYPKMGQDFRLHVYLVDQTDQDNYVDLPVDVDISSWLPADNLSDAPPENHFDIALELPQTLQSGTYAVEFSIVNHRTGLPIQLAIEGAGPMGRYSLGSIKVIPEK
jgi:hypothetical protein